MNDAPKRWTVEETSFLTSNYNNMTARAIADKMGRTITQIEQKAYKLGLRKTIKLNDPIEGRRKLVRQLLNMVRKSAGLPLLGESDT